MNPKKMGRPPIQNPRSKAVHVRLDAETARKLNEYCEEHGLAKTEAIRRGLQKLLDGEKNRERSSLSRTNTYVVFNLFCQDDRVQSDGSLTRYGCMRRCLEQVEYAAHENGSKRVALPGNMGCGIAGCGWNKVHSIIVDMFGASPVLCTIVWWEGDRR